LAFAACSSANATLPQYLADVQPGELVPGATRFDAPAGEPPIAVARDGNDMLGWVFLNADFVSAIGYSGRAINILVGIDKDGVITAAKLVEHHEPIVLIGIPESRITEVLDDYVGLDVVKLVKEQQRNDVDIVSGATVTVMVMDDSIVRAAIKVARRFGLGGLAPDDVAAGPKAVLDTSVGEVQDWIGLVGDGSVRRLKLSIGEVNEAFERSGNSEAMQRAEAGSPDEIFIELYAALVSIPALGKSLLGEREYRNLERNLAGEHHAILIAADGRYSFKGSGYVRGGIFDRFQLIQGDNSIRFRDRHHKRLRRIAADGSPTLAEVDLFELPDDASFDGAKPWTLELLVGRATGPTTKAFETFELAYQPPQKFLKFEAAPGAQPAATPQAEQTDTPLWHRLWLQKIPEIVVLIIALGVLTAAFFFQNSLVRDQRLIDWLRTGFLIFTVIGIGFYANAQLSVVNILTVFNALVTGFSWEYFLMEPLIFIQWGAIAAALLFWGRGAYCGWLCPFGALQELLNKLAKRLRVPQFNVPWGFHERLWPVKYIIFLVLFGVSLHSLAWAERLAEVEPFKTAVILKFMREWPFVVFAAAMLTAGLFVERFYCRYLCALGAALAIPGKLRMFEWLKRYNECGKPCQRCANDCMVQAIHPEGHINPNECLYCLNCQVMYFDDQRCPVMIQRRLKREGRSAGKKKDQLAELMVEFGDVKSPN
jgi:NosR/NirI family nitrous oxide reductase transcriptional regulator